MKRSFFAWPYVVWMIVFTVLPLLFVAYYGFTDATGALSLDNWREFFTSGDLRTLWLSVRLALECTAVCLVVGYPAAAFLAGKDMSRHKTLFVLILLPMWMNFLLRTYAMRTMLQDNGLINAFFEAVGIGRKQMLYTEGAVLLGMVYNYLPFMILPIYTCMKKMDRRVVEAAEDLGANPLQVFSQGVPAVVGAGHRFGHYHGVHACGYDFRHFQAPGRRHDLPHRRHDREHVHDAEKLAVRFHHFHDSAGGNHRFRGPFAQGGPG